MMKLSTTPEERTSNLLREAAVETARKAANSLRSELRVAESELERLRKEERRGDENAWSLRKSGGRRRSG